MRGIYEFIIFPIRATCLAELILLNFNIIVIFGEEQIKIKKLVTM
jgi:hypothetical protein